jgi:DNA-binding NtrC family response regulator
MPTVLIVEDKDTMARMLRETLESEGYTARVAASGDAGIRAIGESRFDLVLTDLKLPGADGLEVLRASKEDNPIRPVIIMTAFGTVDVAVEAMKRGAFDFITKPFDVDHLLMLIKRAIENRILITENIALKGELENLLGLPDIVGASEAMRTVADHMRRVAPTQATVLLLGESGTGKELFARALHHMSVRSERPFVTINCAAIPAGLLESEFFGYEKGAFSGAEGRKLGKFEMADTGTVFLDEIGEMDVHLQAKLLRFLQESEIERVGGTKPIRLDVRIVAASNRDIEADVSEGRFREDLFYRLNVFPVTLPPLRARTEDIPALAAHFIEKYAATLRSPVTGLSPEAIELLKGYAWKGNVRELENTIERAIILCDSDTIRTEHLSLTTRSDCRLGEMIDMRGSLEEVGRHALSIVEAARIRTALAECGGNKTRAAETLRVSYKTLLTKIRDYAIE